MENKKIVRVLWGALALNILLFAFFVSLNEPLKISAFSELSSKMTDILNESVILSTPKVQDLPSIYMNDTPESVVFFYVTVLPGDLSEKAGVTWNEVNQFSKWFYTENRVVDVGKANAFVQYSDVAEDIEEDAVATVLLPNATIEIRGASTSLEPQKSYKIELSNGEMDWRGQSVIALNKHIYDPSRFRNKLNYDLMKQIPGMFSLRTQFVQLYVRDFSEGDQQADFVDYGLFTQVEVPGSRYFRSRLLDSTGQLYKATFFEFARYPEDIRLVTDPQFDEQEFFSKLEIKGSNDHSKLIRMLDDLNNYDLPIEYVFERYFDEENYFTWLAYNILVGNVDTQSQNFYLYSPSYEETWYFIPWDYDDSFLRRSRTTIGYSPYQNWEYGIANYWGSHLHNRVLRVEKYRNALDSKINDLMKLLTPELIREMAGRYQSVTSDYMARSPDINYTDYYTAEGIEFDYQMMPENIQLNYDLYRLSLETSMPFYLGTPSLVGGEIQFTWDESYNFDGGEIEYQFAVSDTWDFKEIIYEKTLVDEYSIAIPFFDPGNYCWRVLAVNPIGRIAYSFDEYDDEVTGSHSGMKCFTLTALGEVVER